MDNFKKWYPQNMVIFNYYFSFVTALFLFYITKDMFNSYVVLNMTELNAVLAFSLFLCILPFMSKPGYNNITKIDIERQGLNKIIGGVPFKTIKTLITSSLIACLVAVFQIKVFVIRLDALKIENMPELLNPAWQVMTIAIFLIIGSHLIACIYTANFIGKIKASPYLFLYKELLVFFEKYSQKTQVNGDEILVVVNNKMIPFHKIKPDGSDQMNDLSKTLFVLRNSFTEPSQTATP